METKTVRLGRVPVICFAPQYVCEALLRAEGFADVRYVDTTVGAEMEDLGQGKFDFQSNLPLGAHYRDRWQLPITVVTGVHAGCYELFAHGGIRSIADLKGKSVGRSGGGAELTLDDGSLCRARPEKGLHPGRRPCRQAYGPVRRAQARRISGVSARSRRSCTRAKSAM